MKMRTRGCWNDQWIDDQFVRKRFIGQVLELPVEQRLEGTAAAIAVGITRGADIIRVHDVQAMVRVARMTDALVR